MGIYIKVREEVSMRKGCNQDTYPQTTFKTVQGCQLSETKLTALLKFIFWRKCKKSECMTIEMKIRRMTFFTFLSIFPARISDDKPFLVALVLKSA